jgi:hypothetical protein
MKSMKEFLYLEIDDLMEQSRHPDKMKINDQFKEVIEGIEDKKLLERVTFFLYDVTDQTEKDGCEILESFLSLYEEKVGS